MLSVKIQSVQCNYSVLQPKPWEMSIISTIQSTQLCCYPRPLPGSPHKRRSRGEPEHSRAENRVLVVLINGFVSLDIRLRWQLSAESNETLGLLLGLNEGKTSGERKGGDWEMCSKSLILYPEQWGGTLQTLNVRTANIKSFMK